MDFEFEKIIYLFDLFSLSYPELDQWLWSQHSLLMSHLVVTFDFFCFVNGSTSYSFSLFWSIGVYLYLIIWKCFWNVMEFVFAVEYSLKSSKIWGCFNNQGGVLETKYSWICFEFISVLFMSFLEGFLLVWTLNGLIVFSFLSKREAYCVWKTVIFRVLWA